MIRDRGRIKWTSMMLPEHVRLLRDWAKEDQWKEGKKLDEQKLEELDAIVQWALKYNKKVVLHYYKDHQYETVQGVIHSFDLIEKEVRLIDSTGERWAIPVTSIHQIEGVEE